MDSFKTFLAEMTIADAKFQLGITDSFDEKGLKTAYRRASSKAHPDKGGTTEDQQKVNAAYELLKKNVGRAQDIDDRKAKNQEWRDMAQMVRQDLVKNFKSDVYTKYFNSVFGEEFSQMVTKLYPDDAELSRLANTPSGRVAHNVYYEVEWANSDRTKVLSIMISVYMANLFRAAGLASPGTTYEMGVFTYAYINGRKVKITKRDYNHTAKKAVFNTPASVFPKAKLVRKNQTKFKKSDMISALKSELKATISGDYFFVPLKDDKYLALSRHTMMRKGVWSVHGIYFKPGPHNFRMDMEYNDNRSFMSLPESEDTLNLFRKIKNGDPKKVIGIIQVEYKKWIK